MIMIRKPLSFTYVLALASAITSLQAQAGGLWITEYGQRVLQLAHRRGLTLIALISWSCSMM